MEMRTQKEFRINIDVSDGEIKLERNHAVAAYADEVITWSSEGCVFAVQFPPGAPFTVENNGNLSTMIMPKDAIPCLPYKYTIAAFDNKHDKVLIVDPVLVRIPPKG
ncbi:MAG: hypothetical protein MUP71_05335 [Candidatus Aminicenantes bacterium]|nr:hypothetical protein [Candidatus Aminicenantes bacterium]